MNESGVTGQLLIHLRGDPNLVVDKHADRFTSGIADVSVVGPGDWTTWLEVKNLKNSETLISFIKRERTGKIQLHKMHRIGHFTRAFYLVYRSASLEVRLPWMVLEDFQRNEETPANIVDQVPGGADTSYLTRLIDQFAPVRFCGKSLHHIVRQLCYMERRPHGPISERRQGVSREDWSNDSGDCGPGESGRPSAEETPDSGGVD